MVEPLIPGTPSILNMQHNHILLRCDMPSRALTRRDPPKGKNGFSNYKGFTVIELMIVIAVVAIITSLALPSYRTLIEKRQVTSGAEQIAAFLSSAQLEAVKRNRNVAVSYSYTDNTDWCIGMIVDADSCDCSSGSNTCVIDGAAKVFTPLNLNYEEALAGVDGDGTFVIDPVRGMMVDFTDATTFQLLSTPENSYALNVNIGPTGRLSICSDGDRADKAVPGFDSCQ